MTRTTTEHTAQRETGAELADMIVKTTDTCGGRARIAGTRIKVEHIYNWVERQGMSPDAVINAYPHLNKAQVHAALAYYWSHEAEIQHDIAEDERFVAEMKAKAGPSKLTERVADLHAQGRSASTWMNT
jgi:uncharacterized protein (DUF433 family)